MYSTVYTHVFSPALEWRYYHFHLTDKEIRLREAEPVSQGCRVRARTRLSLTPKAHALSIQAMPPLPGSPYQRKLVTDPRSLKPDRAKDGGIPPCLMCLK